MSATARVKRPGCVVVGLHGPRPQPLSLPAAARPSKKPREDDGPVIVYEHTPKVIHARPDEFKALVQRLTGRQQPVDTAAAEMTTASSPDEEAGDPLVLTLGKQEPPQQLHDHYTPALQLPSPGGGLAAADFLFSPGSFLFSPATMRAIQELIS